MMVLLMLLLVEVGGVGVDVVDLCVVVADVLGVVFVGGGDVVAVVVVVNAAVVDIVCCCLWCC